MERYESLLTQLKECKEGTFVPFVTLGDPGIEQPLKTVDMLIETGADAPELGASFPDSPVDDPTIQGVILRAFAAKVTPAQCFEMLVLIRQKHSIIPVGLLVHADLIFSKGIDEFYTECEKVGVDSVLVADVPMEESTLFRQAALCHNVAPIFICPSNTDDDSSRQMAFYGHGHTYLLSRTDVTGAESRVVLSLNHLVAKLKEYNIASPLQEFGTSAPDQVKATADAGAVGAISGSVTVKAIEQHVNESEKMLATLKAFVQPTKTATRG